MRRQDRSRVVAIGLGLALGTLLLLAPSNAGAAGRGRGAGDDLRAFAGAPPVIPHAVEALGRQICVKCHGPRGLVTASGLRARPSPHAPNVIACRQCHVEQLPDAGRMVRGTSVTWRGLEPRPVQPRANPTGPPVIPHRLFMRENCEACHGRAGEPELQVDHAKRIACLTCHAVHPEDPTLAKESYIRGADVE